MREFRLYSDMSAWLLKQPKGTEAKCLVDGRTYSRERMILSIGYDASARRGLLGEYKELRGL